MLRKLFGKSDQPSEELIVAPVTGKLIKLEDVPDPVFSQRMMGDGLAIEPTEGKVVSPVDGEIIQVFPTKHAVGIIGKSGVEILIHIGLETVSMNGEGFETYVKQGDKVKIGQELVSFDLKLIEEKAASTITPMIITNGEKFAALEKMNPELTEAGVTELLNIKVKA